MIKERARPHVPFASAAKLRPCGVDKVQRYAGKASDRDIGDQEELNPSLEVPLTNTFLLLHIRATIGATCGIAPDLTLFQRIKPTYASLACHVMPFKAPNATRPCHATAI